MKTVPISFTLKFPAKKVTDCFANTSFAKIHKASKLFAKAGILKSDKKMIVKTLAFSDADKTAVPAIAVITFADAEAGKATIVSATFVNVPDAKAEFVKGLGKIIADEMKTFLTPAPAKAVAKAPAKKPGPKAGAKKTGPKPAAKKVAAKKPAAKAPVKKAAVGAQAKKPVAKPAAKAAPKPLVVPPVIAPK